MSLASSFSSSCSSAEKLCSLSALIVPGTVCELYSPASTVRELLLLLSSLPLWPLPRLPSSLRLYSSRAKRCTRAHASSSWASRLTTNPAKSGCKLFCARTATGLSGSTTPCSPNSTTRSKMGFARQPCTHCAPASTVFPQKSIECSRPPNLSPPSSSNTSSTPSRLSSCAAARPASPPPTMMTDGSVSLRPMPRKECSTSSCSRSVGGEATSSCRYT
mmetsp:Transcript_15725/g.40071  ORF Transcript_15725/g.40071 Transcript_15725/m.40071 type:complete len:218 (+) Transcript_15725:1252-1905(+)